MEPACPVSDNNHNTDCSTLKLNTLGEKHELALEDPLPGTHAQDNCQPMDCSSLKPNILVTNNETESGLVPSETLGVEIIGSDAGGNCQKLGSSIGEESTLGPIAEDSHQTVESSNQTRKPFVEGNGMSLQYVPSEPTEKTAGCHAGENHQESSCLIPEGSIVGSDLQGIHKKMNVSSPRKKPFANDSEMDSNCAQSEPMDTGTVGFVVTENHQEMPSLTPEESILRSDAQDNHPNMEVSSLGKKPFAENNEMGSRCAHSEPMGTGTIGSDAAENHQEMSSSIAEESILEADAQDNYPKIEGSSPRQKPFAEDTEMAPRCAQSENPLADHNPTYVPSERLETGTIKSDAEENNQTLRSSSLKETTLGEKSELVPELVRVETKTCESMDITSANNVGNEQVEGEPMETNILGSDNVAHVLLGTPTVDMMTNSEVSANKESGVVSRSLKRKHSKKSPSGTDRVLRSKLRDTSKPSDPSPSSVNVTPGSVNVTSERKKRKKRKKTDRPSKDVFSKTRQHLRYFLSRMGYEHNLIEAYSGEGWKGQSSEKIKPEKELQRASSEILRYKRRIRDLFQHLDSLCMEGKLQDDLFDSEGQISSEDIFCAKCGSKDLSADNDIILCDGICDRGFHQLCLEPPLLKEEIPPEDEGWLCPGCDCKVDCIDLLNDLQGMDLSINDDWEKVFPEAATTAGDLLDNNLSLPSDDSEDDDYDPDGLELEEEVQTDASSSDESDFSSTSDDSGIVPNDDQYAGLPSDDSEDDDFDPNVPDIDHNKTESSSSDFTSDSEYFSASSDGNGPSVTGKVFVASIGSEMDANKKMSVNPELLALQEPDLGQGNSSPVLGKRQRERLDYKKLHDEEYGNGPSDSSDDEDWFEADTSDNIKETGDRKESSVSSKANSRNSKGGRTMKETSQKSKETAVRRTRQKLSSKGEDTVSSKTRKDSPSSGHIRKSATASTSKTLGDAVTQVCGDDPSSDNKGMLEADTANTSKETSVGKESSISLKANSRKGRRNTKVTRQNFKGTKTRKTHKKLGSEGEDPLLAETQKDGPESGNVKKRATASASKTLGEAITQRLYAVFKENEYPKRGMKENLSKELGLTFSQVTKWFGNARFSSRHSSGNKENKVSPSKDGHVAQTSITLSDLELKGVASNAVEDQELSKEDTAKAAVTECTTRDLEEPKVVTEKSTPGKSGSTKSRNLIVVTEESTPAKSGSTKSRNRRNSKVGGETSKEDTTTTTKDTLKSTPTSAGTPSTPLRRSGRNKNQEVTQSQIKTRSRSGA